MAIGIAHAENIFFYKYDKPGLPWTDFDFKCLQLQKI